MEFQQNARIDSILSSAEMFSRLVDDSRADDFMLFLHIILFSLQFNNESFSFIKRKIFSAICCSLQLVLFTQFSIAISTHGWTLEMLKITYASYAKQIKYIYIVYCM